MNGAGSQLLEAGNPNSVHCERHQSHGKNLFPVAVRRLAEDCANDSKQVSPAQLFLLVLEIVIMIKKCGEDFIFIV